ncbi:TrkH family potassium uptake protein [Shumkonia mesophila]|uniref:TrkH family potassium uptake protein n=1 Tax=Shumkonia mesophila TaxID=2838854 RepID=UPI002934B768|nr:TrkH family potassium uptake protein [Shumkonia mesophila]
MTAKSLQFVLFINGILLCILATVMLIPAAVDGFLGDSDWHVFTLSSATTFAAGVSLVLAYRGDPPPSGSRSGYLLTAVSWVLTALFGSLPLMFSSLNLSFTDAFFETMSGLTTTGSTVLSGLDSMAPGLLLWRSLLQWIGGVGIVVMAIVLLPALRVGGMELFRTESSDISEKTVPQAYRLAGVTALVYLGLSVACAISMMAAGMGPFDAINHAMTTLATGGYSTKDSSVGFFDSVPIEVVTEVFMVSGALPLIFYARIILLGRRAFQNEWQVGGFLKILAVTIGLAAVWNITQGMPVGQAIRQAAFNVTSILTDTGYATTDFGTWGSFAIGLFFVLYFIGGCAGSTAGAIKVFRWQILFASARRQIRLMSSPHRVLVVRYAGRPVGPDMMESVRNFFFLYLLTFMALAAGVMTTGVDFLSSTTAIAQAMANAGPGLGPLVGPATTFAALPAVAKWLIAVGMLLGRLELATVYVLFAGCYWRR